MDIPDKGVDLNGVDIIELLESLLDLSLVGLDVDDENKGVVLLNLLHSTLSVERVDDDLVLIETGLMRDRLSWVLGVAGELKGLGSVEGSRETDLSDLVGVSLLHVSIDNDTWTEIMRTYALQSSLSSSAGLLVALALGGSTCKTYASAIAL